MEQDKFSLGSLAFDWGSSTFWVVLIYGLVINLQNFGIDQSYVQRYITAKSDRAAARSVWIGALLYLPIGAAFFFIGTALYAFYQAQPELLPASLNAAQKPDAVFPYYISRELPAGLAGWSWRAYARRDGFQPELHVDALPARPAPTLL